MAMFNVPRVLGPVVLAAALGLALLVPGKAQASDDLVRVLVDVADVIYQRGQPYYRYGDYGRYDRVVIVRDRHHRPSYYRYVPRGQRVVYRNGPPYGYAPGYYRQPPRHDYRRDYRRDRYSNRHDRREREDYGRGGRGRGQGHGGRGDD